MRTECTILADIVSMATYLGMSIIKIASILEIDVQSIDYYVNARSVQQPTPGELVAIQALHSELSTRIEYKIKNKLSMIPIVGGDNK